MQDAAGAARDIMKKMPTKVAIVEDDRKAREIFVEWINRAEGFRCMNDYGCAEDALAALPKLSPEVVFMDINLPGMNGVECVRQLKAQLPETQFVMLTVYEDSDHIFQALQAGATGYLLKRTPRAELVAALRNVEAGGSPMTTNIARKVVKAFHQMTAPQPPVAELSARENEVLQLLAQGFLYKEIAEALNVAVPTVNTYIRRIYEKLHVRSRTEAVARFAHLPVRGVAPQKFP
jgi:DNA-binding NarL/FixJ family response regulator